ncbi:MAG TPA: potassium/proton antiporter [Rectinemataceae bacterium]
MLLTISVILVFLTLSATIFRRFNLPLIILALAIGIIFGSDVTGLVYFDDAVLTKRVADLALVFVLFAGGYSIQRAELKPVLAPTMTLATLGVLMTIGITTIILRFVGGWDFSRSLLVAVVISSTDASAVFSILKNHAVQRRPSSITEIESAANDPMAIVSTAFVVKFLSGAGIEAWRSVLELLWQMGGGLGLGLAVGWAGSLLFRKIRDVETGYYYLLLVGIILASYGVADTVGASGMLSAFFAGYFLGNRKFPFKSSLSSFVSALSFMANAGLFILLGLLMFPRSLGKVWGAGLLVFIALSFVSRPITVFLCTAFRKIPLKEKVFISWSGMRASVPIVLATYPLAAGLDPGHEILNIIFVAVCLSLLVQGTSIGWLAGKLGLRVKKPLVPKQKMELVTVHETKYELVEVFVDPERYSGERKLSELDLPAEANVTMIARKDRMLVPRGQTSIKPGDVLTLLVEQDKAEDAASGVLAGFERI